MSVVIDASIAAVLFVDDARRAVARRVFAHERPLLAPTIILAEVANALWKISRRGESPPHSAVRTYLALELPERLRLTDDRILIGDAWRLAAELDQPVYDCLYLALALREECRVVSVDLRFTERLSSTRYAGIVTVPT